MNIQITQARYEDAGIVHDVMQKAFQEYQGKLTPPSGALLETPDDVRRKMSNDGGAIIATVNGQFAGSSQYSFKHAYVYIGRVSVLPSFRGLRIGKKMVAYIEDIARTSGVGEAQLEVRLSIPSNVTYYQNLQYEIISKHDYPNQTDQYYTMRKWL
ncbi:GNAT family N-acetyltransferase [Paenibacillus hexagrammi]|uniref:GNAT family N-acetyltransferase n=1 Tax=Paenibacillus hexagrammi TaxID=2908839 RepID=A0ABY3SF09_9BACL|nr:GNAT family N-acetyltransferase [Paenibacillus sp. YPD9-1]UJF31771.1 GNAT family N-acetyltransferase [Paenibacillus sp. YPD9-1]